MSSAVLQGAICGSCAARKCTCVVGTLCQTLYRMAAYLPSADRNPQGRVSDTACPEPDTVGRPGRLLNLDQATLQANSPACIPFAFPTPAVIRAVCKTYSGPRDPNLNNALPRT